VWNLGDLGLEGSDLNFRTIAGDVEEERQSAK
jgi:hypothetical protein